MRKCWHEVPCTCYEYLNRLTEEDLLNLRIQFGKTIMDADAAITSGSAIPVITSTFVDGAPQRPNAIDRWIMGRMAKKRAARNSKEVNRVLKEKFGYIVI